MDPSAMPWRVLEDPANKTEDGEGVAGADPDVSGRLPRPALLTGGLAILLAVGAFALAWGSGSSGSVDVEGALPLQSGAPSPGSTDGGVQTASRRLLVVEIVGAVERPGVFRLAAGTRIGDLVAAAGGYGPGSIPVGPVANSTWRQRSTTATRPASHRATRPASRAHGRPVIKPGAPGRPPPRWSTSIAPPRPSSTHCPASGRSRPPRSSPRGTNSPSPRSRTFEPESSSARRRSSGSRTS